MLRFLHLSDVHFLAADPSKLGRNQDMRNRVLDDLRAIWGHDPCDAILITGDIAYSGMASEYDAAGTWISQVEEAVTAARVLVTPGNHDINRRAHSRSTALRTSIEWLKSSRASEIDRRLQDLLSDELGSAHLLTPLAEYNHFARSYDCELQQDQPVWSADFKLHDGVIVRVHGLCSAYACNHRDDRGNVVLGEFQSLLPQYEPGVVHIVLCHHPPDWLKDHDLVERALTARASLQLFGHKHQRRICLIDDSLQVVAGAVFPEENGPDWLPSYGIIELNHVDEESVRIRVMQRVWNPDDHAFYWYPNPRTQEDWREEVLPFRARISGGSRRDEPIPVVAPIALGEAPTAIDDVAAVLELMRELPEAAQLRALRRTGILSREHGDAGIAAVGRALAAADEEQLESLRRIVLELHGALFGEE